jgi:hypothetical protein
MSFNRFSNLHHYFKITAYVRFSEGGGRGYHLISGTVLLKFKGIEYFLHTQLILLECVFEISILTNA